MHNPSGPRGRQELQIEVRGSTDEVLLNVGLDGIGIILRHLLILPRLALDGLLSNLCLLVGTFLNFKSD